MRRTLNQSKISFISLKVPINKAHDGPHSKCPNLCTPGHSLVGNIEMD